MELKKIGTLGFRRWGTDWATCWDFLRENELEPYESWLFDTRCALKHDIPLCDYAYMLMRLTLYQFPFSWYSEQIEQRKNGGGVDVDGLAFCWYRLTHTPEQVNEIEQFRKGNFLRGASEEYDFTQQKINAATPFATAADGNRLRLLEETGDGYGYAVDEIYRERNYRNDAADVVARGFLYSLDALADGVPAAYL